MNAAEIWASMQPKDFFTVLLSSASFILAGYALWVAQFNRGRLKMTRPTLVCLKLEFHDRLPKFFFRMLLFTTGTKGRVVEHIFLKVHRLGKTFVFDRWAHTESGRLTPGSGLFVGPTGIACDHHFNPRRGSTDFLFAEGEYRVEVCAAIIGRSSSKRLMELAFIVRKQEAAALTAVTEVALCLLWNDDTRIYEGYLERPPGR